MILFLTATNIAADLDDEECVAKYFDGSLVYQK